MPKPPKSTPEIHTRQLVLSECMVALHIICGRGQNRVRALFNTREQIVPVELEPADVALLVGHLIDSLDIIENAQRQQFKRQQKILPLFPDQEGEGAA